MTTTSTATPAFGFTEWFRRGEHLRVEQAIDGMKAAGAKYLRTHLSWAEYHAPGGQAWFDCLMPRLGAAFDLLPCIHYTPPSLSRTGASSGPPVRLKDYADFVDHVLTRYGRTFTSIELWNEPNNLLDWDSTVDPHWLLFSEMVGNAAWWAEKRGFRAVLGGPSPFDIGWLDLMGERGVLGVVSAVGFHGFPGTWDSEDAAWRGYGEHIAAMREVLDAHNPKAEIWITEAGYSTWRNDEAEQLRRFGQALAAPAVRLYWYGWQDIPKSVPVQEGLYFDPRHYHMGVTDADGRPKLLRRLLEQRRGAKPWPSLTAPSLAPRSAPIVVVGGAGFIGSNLAESYLAEGRDVVVLDNLSRPDVERNLAWLQANRGAKLHVAIADIRDEAAVADVVRGACGIFHLAAQVAVTSSLVDPMHDFAVNGQGTLTLLEALRRHAPNVPLVFASTNKVYGALSSVATSERAGRYAPDDETLRKYGIDETSPLDFCTPYGCSKGTADQYVLDYAHSFGLRTAVLRMSCIYGPRQFGTEDQGWVAHFLIKALHGEPITVYGDGKQVRDILNVGDAVAAYRGTLDAIDRVSGRAFNLGGGPANAVSVAQVLSEIERQCGTSLDISRSDSRIGDQLYFVADTRRLQKAIGWRPTVGWRQGLAQLRGWLIQELGQELWPAAQVTQETLAQETLAKETLAGQTPDQETWRRIRA